jgi:hypothetical protein
MEIVVLGEEGVLELSDTFGVGKLLVTEMGVSMWEGEGEDRVGGSTDRSDKGTSLMI